MRIAFSVLLLVVTASCVTEAPFAGPDLSATTTAKLDMAMATGCINGVFDGDETDIDCGGSCPPCGSGMGCLRGPDCASTFCVNKMCAAPTCSDGVRNGSESDVDCGFLCPTRCSEGKKCADGPDCGSLTCVNGVCGKSPCENGKQDGMETDVDCGGPVCPKCGGGKMCSDGPDCAGGMCVNNVCTSNCPMGMGDCDGDAANGCEANTNDDAKNCGGCGNVCPMRTPVCLLGACKGQPEIKVGNATPLPDPWEFVPGQFQGTSIVLAGPATLLRLGFYLTSGAGNVVLAVYSNRNGVPDQLVSSTPVSAIGKQPQEIAVAHQLVPAGTFWIMIQNDQKIHLGTDMGTPGPYAYAPQNVVGFGAPPPQMFPLPRSIPGFMMNLWVVVQ